MVQDGILGMRTGSLFYLLCLCLLINVVRSFWFFGNSKDTSMADQKKGVEVPRFATPEYEPPSQPKTWPALVGMDGDAAKDAILQDMPDLLVVVLPEDSMVTRDFRLDRVRVFVDNDSKVSKPPLPYGFRDRMAFHVLRGADPAELGERYAATFDYTAHNPDEMSLAEGEVVIVLDKSDRAWWLARKADGQQGYIPADYVHPKLASPVSGSPKPTVMRTEPESPQTPGSFKSPYKTPRSRQMDGSMSGFRSKEECIDELLASEERYCTSLDNFYNSFLENIRLRDTAERRSLCYGNKAFSIACDLLRVIREHNACLLSALRVAGNDHSAVARALIKFAPAAKVYALCAANHAEALAGVDKLSAALTKYSKENPLPGGYTIQKYLGMPMERFPMYLQFITVIAKYARPASSDVAAASKALEEGLTHMEDTVDEYQRQTELVNLQAQFMGYVDLYAPERRLLKEATLKKIYIDNSGRKPVDRHFHLFTDALLYSAKLIGPYKYKLAKIYSLDQVESCQVLREDNTMFDIALKGGETIRFQAPDTPGTVREWVDFINETVNTHKAKLEWEAVHGKQDQSREESVNVVSFIKKIGDIARLPERSRTIAYGLKAELTYMEYLKAFSRVAVILDEMSRGIGVVGNADVVEERGKGLFETKVKGLSSATEGMANRAKAQAQSKILQSSEIGVFIKVVPIIESLTESVVKELEARMTSHKQTGAELRIGDIYCDLRALFTAYKLYATVVLEAMNVLPSKELADFMEAISDQLSPLTMEQHINAPVEAAKRIALQLKAALDVTLEGHPDRSALSEAAALAAECVEAMDKNRQDTVDYWKLVSIRESITSVEFKDSRLDTLINSERKLIMEGFLVKKSRSKNQKNMFWLCNDILMYAAQITGGGFVFSRWMNLTEIKAELSQAEPNGIDILSAEKSFVVLCKDEQEKQAWFNALTSAIEDTKVKAGLAPDAETFEAAPILVQSTERNECTICHAPFTFFVRKHHCLKCGIVVCDKCSPSRILLPNIHKTTRQRVCNQCVNGASDFDTPAARSSAASRGASMTGATGAAVATAAACANSPSPPPTASLLDMDDPTPAPAPTSSRAPPPPPPRRVSSPVSTPTYAPTSPAQDMYTSPAPLNPRTAPPVPPQRASMSPHQMPQQMSLASMAPMMPQQMPPAPMAPVATMKPASPAPPASDNPFDDDAWGTATITTPVQPSPTPMYHHQQAPTSTSPAKPASIYPQMPPSSPTPTSAPAFAMATTNDNNPFADTLSGSSAFHSMPPASPVHHYAPSTPQQQPMYAYPQQQHTTGGALAPAFDSFDPMPQTHTQTMGTTMNKPVTPTGLGTGFYVPPPVSPKATDDDPFNF